MFSPGLAKALEPSPNESQGRTLSTRWLSMGASRTDGQVSCWGNCRNNVCEVPP